VETQFCKTFQVCWSLWSSSNCWRGEST